VSSLVCVDASLIVWSLVPAALSDAAQALLEEWKKDQVTLIAPALLAFEVTSTLRRLVFLAELTSTEGEEAFEKFLGIDIGFLHQRGIFPLAWQLAKRLNLPRASDSAYLAVAQLRNCEFWTADERLYNTVSHELAWVKWLGGYKQNRFSEEG
jgi:predicted nucleic acid-binding protein